MLPSLSVPPVLSLTPEASKVALDELIGILPLVFESVAMPPPWVVDGLESAVGTMVLAVEVALLDVLVCVVGTVVDVFVFYVSV